jgi:hypothetical protein
MLTSRRGRANSEHTAAAAHTAAATTHAATGTRRTATLLLIGTQALASATRRFTHLLPSLHGRLHVVTATLELTQNSFRGHAALEMLDRPLDALVSDLDLEWLTRYGFARIRQGRRCLTRIAA